jgi:ATPase subunit of ABC transporter with duplicated ATPase domains
MELSNLNLNGFELLKGQLNKLGKINILVGPNGSGKSSVLRFLQSNTKPKSRTASYCSIVAPSVKTTLSFEHFKKIVALFPNAVVTSEDTEKTTVTESPRSKTVTTTKDTVNFLNGTPVSALSETGPGGYRLAARILSEIEIAAKPKTHQVGTVETALNL